MKSNADIHSLNWKRFTGFCVCLKCKKPSNCHELARQTKVGISPLPQYLWSPDLEIRRPSLRVSYP